MVTLVGPRVQYVVDTSSLIQLKQVYPLVVFPTVWSRVEELINQGVLISCEDVLEELSEVEDDLYAWAMSRREMFRPLDVQVQAVARKILATHPHLIDIKKRKSSADPFVIATAMVCGCAVVAEERFAATGARPRIPDVCRYYGIRCIRLLDSLLETGLRV